MFEMAGHMMGNYCHGLNTENALVIACPAAVDCHNQGQKETSQYCLAIVMSVALSDVY